MIRRNLQRRRHILHWGVLEHNSLGRRNYVLLTLHNHDIFGSPVLPWKSGSISPLLRSSTPGAIHSHTYET